jgi:hypothetical protein
MNFPDAYRFILIDNSLIKLFASWDGGWAISEEWKLNSGVTDIIPLNTTYVEYGYDVHGYSGSIYTIRKEQGRLNSYTSGVYRGILKKLEDADVPVKEVSLQEAIEYLEENK